MTARDAEATVTQMLPAVYAIAKHVARMCRLRETDDLIGDGSLGLMKAIKNYKPDRGVSFDCYARFVILGSILNGLRNNDPVSERARRLVRRAECLRAQLEARGESPSEADLRAAIPGLERARAQIEQGYPLSLDATLPLGYRLSVDWSGDPARVFEHRRRRRILRKAVDALQGRQREIVVDHYFGDVPLRMISARLAVTPQRVSQLHCMALARLRDAMHAAGG